MEDKRPRPGCMGLIMAGGRGSRMLASGVAVPKALLPVGGVSLLERNLYAFLRSGITEVSVSVSAEVPDVGREARFRLAAVAAAARGQLDVLEEDRPLGNIGAARALRRSGGPVVVTYADNLTTLDLDLVLCRHLASGADLTLAAHHQPLRMPYGELIVDGDDVVDYLEKPVRRPLIASAVVVLSPAAMDWMPADDACGLVELFARVKDRGGRVVAVRHTEPWVDVNDANAWAEAAQMMAGHQPALDRWAPDAVATARVVLAQRDGRVLLAPVADGTWTLPAAAGWHEAEPWISFDSVERYGVGAEPVRYQVIVAAPGDEVDDGRVGMWVALAEVDGDDLSDTARRALALAG